MRTKSFLTAAKIFSGIILFVFLSLFGLYLLVLAGIFGKLATESDLAGIRNEEATLIYSSDSALIGKIFNRNRTNIQPDEVPDFLVNALVSTEDKRFFSHSGIDNISYLRVFIKSILTADRSSGGGSTISQQLIKNLYGRRNLGILMLPVYKIKEAIEAIRLEKVYSKEEIIVLYLNTVSFGENVYGIEAGAQRFFSKSTDGLNIQESALLVGMLKANTFYNPRIHPQNALNRRNQVLQLMQNSGYIEQIAADSLQNLPLELQYSNYEIEAPAGYFVYQVEMEAESILSKLNDKEGKQYNLNKSGLKIYTTLDLSLQDLAMESVKSHLSGMQKLLDSELARRRVRIAWEKTMNVQNDPIWKDNPEITGEIFSWTEESGVVGSYRDSLWYYYSMLNAAVLMIEPGNGKIRSWVGGNNFRYLPYDLVLSRRQIASAFKPIFYCAAIEQGISPCTYLDNEEKDYEDYDGWHPRNFDNSTGNKIAMWYALAHSINLPTVDLYFKTGFESLNETCRKLGLPVSKGDYPSVALGSMDITLQEIVLAYSAFSNNGIIAEPIFIESIIDSEGKEIYKNNKPVLRQAISAETALQMTALLEKVIDEGTGSTLRTKYKVNSEIAGKTGTSQNYSDAWFISFSPNLVMGVWSGAMDPNVHFNSSNGSGSALALPIAGNIWNHIEKSPKLKGKYTGYFQLPESVISQMDCEPVKEQFFKNIYENLFDKKEESQKRPSAKPKAAEEEKSKIGKFFKKVFKGDKK